MRSRYKLSFPFLAAALAAGLLTGCAGWSRQFTSWSAGSFGADWIITQFGADGHPFNCWKLSGVSVSNEEHSDGIYWQNSDGHLVHISGWHNRVQVSGGNFEKAAAAVGVDAKKCGDGHYTP